MLKSNLKLKQRSCLEAREANIFFLASVAVLFRLRRSQNKKECSIKDIIMISKITDRCSNHLTLV